MMLPILISVSVAPVSYFFWASALPLMAAKAMTAVENAAIRSFCLESIVQFLLGLSWPISFLEVAGRPGDQSGFAGAAKRKRSVRFVNLLAATRISSEPGHRRKRACSEQPRRAERCQKAK